MKTIDTRTPGTLTTARGRIRKAVLPLLIATILGTGAAVSAPALYAAPSFDAKTGAQTSEPAQTDPAQLDPAKMKPAQAEPVAAASTSGDETAPAPDQALPKKGMEQTIAKVSEEGMEAMQNLHAARLSIFEGRTDEAREQVGKAEQLLTQAKGDATTLQKKGTKGGDGAQDLYIPIGGTISLADAFVPTDAHRPALDKAGEQISGKDTAGAIDTLRLAAIDVTYTEVMMPLTSTEQHVKEAQGLLEQGKFHEANLAMLKAEQGIVINSLEMGGPVEAPAQKG